MRSAELAVRQIPTHHTQCTQDRMQAGLDLCLVQIALLASTLILLQPVQAAGVQATGATINALDRSHLDYRPA